MSTENPFAGMGDMMMEAMTRVERSYQTPPTTKKITPGPIEVKPAQPTVTVSESPKRTPTKEGDRNFVMKFVLDGGGTIRSITENSVDATIHGVKVKITCE